jgi:outer membrane protein assembly factor BamB
MRDSIQLERIPLRVLGALLGVAFASCSEAGPTIDTRIARVTIHGPVGLAGERSYVQAVVRDTADEILTGIPVRFALEGTEAGTLDSLTSVTNEAGIAVVWWNVPSRPGTYMVTAQAGHLSERDTLVVAPGRATRVELAASEVLITRFWPSLNVEARLFDRFGNLGAYPHDLQVQNGAPVFAFVESNVLSLYSPKHVRGAGDIVIRAPGANGAELARITVTLRIGIDSISLVEASSFEGLAVGESLTLTATVRDSAGNPRTFAPSFIGAPVGSADPTVAEVQGNVVTGRAAGTTSITVAHEGRTFSNTIVVSQPYDLGGRSTLYTLPSSHMYFQPSTILDASGTSLLQLHDYGRPSAANGSMTFEWRAQDGSRTWSRVWRPASASAVFGHDGLYVSSHDSARTTRFDAQGTELWSVAHSGAMTVDATAVFIGGTTVRAYSPTGASLWSYQPPAGVKKIVASPTRIFVHLMNGLIGLDRSGVELWTREESGMGIADASSTYFTIHSGVNAIGPDGVTRWNVAIPRAGALALGANNTLAVSAVDTLYSLDRTTGALLWKTPTPSSARVLAAGDVLILSTAHYFHLFDAATGERLGRTGDRLPAAPRQVMCTSQGLQFETASFMYRYARCF